MKPAIGELVMNSEPVRVGVCAIAIENVQHPLWMRPETTDRFCIHQIFANREYDFKLSVEPEVIVDAGANAGFAAVLFANRYPNTTIFAIEPERSNFELLRINSRPYRNIVPIHAALWHKNEMLAVTDPGSGLWGFQVHFETESEAVIQRVPGLTIDHLLAVNHLDGIDLLKIDIEGAEKLVFEAAASWIGAVQTIVVELHDRFQPGCSAAFEAAVARDFLSRHCLGENVLVSRATISGLDDH